MQFNHPEILALLGLLIIPILIHLFQLQRFKKEAFTNVKFLREIELESRKSSRLKKLLILISRLLALTCLIFAFAQPVIKSEETGQNRKTIVYLDNALSMQATDKNGSELLETTKGLLIDEVDKLPGDLALITNDKIRDGLSLEDLKQELTAISYQPARKDFSQILLETGNLLGENEFDGADVFLFSDFRRSESPLDSLPQNDTNRYFLIPVRSDPFQNVSLDSLWISTFERSEVRITGRLNGQNVDIDNLSVSLVLNGQLFGKTSITVSQSEPALVEFSVPPETTGNGAMIFSDPRLGFDNSMFFSLPKPINPKVLIIGSSSDYLSRIYVEDSFEVTFTKLADLNQGSISDYDLILLNELDQVPPPLARNLKSYAEELGNLVIIPSPQPDLSSYQTMFNTLEMGKITSEFERKKVINAVSDRHPFFENVFRGEVRNFDFPEANYGVETILRSSTALIRFDDGSAFASEIPTKENRIYWIASPLDGEHSNFRESPLIVPLFYNFSLPENHVGGLYNIIGRSSTLPIRSDSLSGNALRLSNGKEEYIPLQKSTARQVELITRDYPVLPGIYQVLDQEQVLTEQAFNYDRQMIRQEFEDLNTLQKLDSSIEVLGASTTGIKQLNELYSSRSLWQLFTTFALIFLVVEMLIQKLFKN